jgi:molecular chaperone GrpE (heat shock protein)
MRSERWANEIEAIVDSIFPKALVERHSHAVPVDEVSVEPDTEAVDTGDTPPAPKRALTEISDQLAVLQQSFDARLKYDEVREQQVAKLYDELDAYKRNDRTEFMLTLARGVFLVLDKLTPSSEFPVSPEMLREELLECLAAVGVERIDHADGQFDVRSETVVGFLDDDSPTASAVVSDGYRLGERVIRPRKVLVRREAVDA